MIITTGGIGYLFLMAAGLKKKKAVEADPV